MGLLVLVQAGAVRAQETKPEQPDAPNGQGLTLPTDAALAQKLAAARDYIREHSWDEVAYVLRALLDSKQDVLIPVQRDLAVNQEVTHWTGVRAEAYRLLAALPARGHEVYERTSGSEARALLAAARKEGDLPLLAEVARRYPNTAAGVEATRLLGVYHLDRGRFASAALCFERLLRQEDADRLPPVVLFAAAVAFHRAGDAVRAEQTWQRLAAAAPNGLRLSGKSLSLRDLEKELSKGAATAADAGEWHLFRGSAGRSAKAQGELAALAAGWQQSTVHEAVTGDWVKAAVRLQEARAQPVLPGFFPVVAGGKAVYRSYRGIHAVDLVTGRTGWEAASEWGLESLVHELRSYPNLGSWINAYLDSNPHVLYENGTLGALSTDGTRVYAVDDLGVPPFPRNFTGVGGRWGQVFSSTVGPGLSDATEHNRLQALDLESGKLLWELGGPVTSVANGLQAAAGRELSDTYFLGPPLPLGDKLYVLADKGQELRLVCLEAADASVSWSQIVAVAPAKVLADPGRRVQAAHLAYGDGILVCPTQAGVVVGVDLFTRSLAWATAYRRELPPPIPDQFGGRRWRFAPLPPPKLGIGWKASAPLVQSGKVVVAAPDGLSLLCLSLGDGKLLWEADRTEDDLYVAGVFSGKVLLVGRQACRALDLADGKPLWKAETGVPSGLGLAEGKAYYLPLKATAGDRGPAVGVLDLERGAVRAFLPLPGKDVPGNLLFCKGRVLSQTATTLTTYTLSPPR
jgi:outer membrane protein assembly factor BamB